MRQFHPTSIPGGSADPKTCAGMRGSFAGPPGEGGTALKATMLRAMAQVPGVAPRDVHPGFCSGKH